MLEAILATVCLIGFITVMSWWAHKKTQEQGIKTVVVEPVRDSAGMVTRIDVAVYCDKCNHSETLCLHYGGKASVKPLCDCTPYIEAFWPEGIKNK